MGFTARPEPFADQHRRERSMNRDEVTGKAEALKGKTKQAEAI
jgi:hypothetical protein